jgi:hypothetical protein
MHLDPRAAVVLAFWALILGVPGRALGDETDNYTCRGRPLTDAQDTLDAWVNARIVESIARANGRGVAACNSTCIGRELRNSVGATVPHPLTWIPHARLTLWTRSQPSVDRCRLDFRKSIYGARPYDLPWVFPFTGRVIFLADSIRLGGRLVGVDKINHFIREGLQHWRDVDRGEDIASVMARELGGPGRQLLMNEHGLKGLALTGVVAYADLAASYSGFRFWRDLLSPESPSPLVAYDASAGRFVARRRFGFADYVNDAWDEAINRSSFDPVLAIEVAEALRVRGVTLSLTECDALARLPQAELFVNPVCLTNVTVWTTRANGSSVGRFRSTSGETRGAPPFRSSSG